MLINISKELAQQADHRLTWDNENEETFGTTLEHIERMRSLDVPVDDQWVEKVQKHCPQKYRIYNYIEAEDPFAFPGYIIFPDSLDTYLPKEQKIFFGERVKTLYFDPISKAPVIQVDYKFNRDEKRLLLSSERSISFYLEDGSIAEQKKVHLIPVASQFEQLEELKRRRINIVAEVQSLAVSFNLINEMNELYDTQSSAISRYLETGSPLFKNFLVSDKTRAWLKAPATVPGKTIKDILVGYFSIGLLHD
ncbi:MAG: hypothetical protein ACRC2S_28560 [Waterburya sp.]